MKIHTFFLKYTLIKTYFVCDRGKYKNMQYAYTTTCVWKSNAQQ